MSRKVVSTLEKISTEYRGQVTFKVKAGSDPKAVLSFIQRWIDGGMGQNDEPDDIGLEDTDCGEEYESPQVRRPIEDFYSQCPPGYNTIIGYIAKELPHLIVEGYADTPEATLRDGWALKRACKMDVQKVNAPLAFREQGIETLNAYPVTLIREHFAGT